MCAVQVSKGGKNKTDAGTVSLSVGGGKIVWWSYLARITAKAKVQHDHTRGGRGQILLHLLSDFWQQYDG